MMALPQSYSQPYLPHGTNHFRAGQEVSTLKVWISQQERCESWRSLWPNESLNNMNQEVRTSLRYVKQVSGARRCSATPRLDFG